MPPPLKDTRVTLKDVKASADTASTLFAVAIYEIICHFAIEEAAATDTAINYLQNIRIHVGATTIGFPTATAAVNPEVNGNKEFQ